MCQTERTSALSTPMPKALVATITSASPAHEAALGRGALLRLHAGVVGERAAGRRRAATAPPRRCRAGAAVDDRRAVRRVGQPRFEQRLPPRLRAFALEPRRRRRRGWAGRSRSAPAAARAGRSARRSRPPPALVAVAVQAITVGRPSRSAISRQAQVVGPEVVSPLRDAVRLVDRQQVDPPLRQRVEEDVARRSAPASSRRSAPRRCAPGRGRARAASAAHPRGDHRHRVPGRGQPPPLVLHQRDQRADHDRQVLGRQPRQLVAEALAAAGRHHDQRVAPFERGLDRLPLPGPPALEAKLSEQLVGPRLPASRRSSQTRLWGLTPTIWAAPVTTPRQERQFPAPACGVSALRQLACRGRSRSPRR